MSQVIQNLLPSLFTNQVASATHGSPIYFISPVVFDEGFTATSVTITDLYVTGLVNPTGIQFTPVAVNPGNANTIWLNSVDANKPTLGNTNNIVISPSSVLANSVPRFTSDGVIDDTTVTINPANQINADNGSFSTALQVEGNFFSNAAVWQLLSGSLNVMNGNINNNNGDIENVGNYHSLNGNIVLDNGSLSTSLITSPTLVTIDKAVAFTGNQGGFSADFTNDIGSTNADIRLTNGGLFLTNGNISVSNNGLNDLPTVATKTIQSNDPNNRITCNSSWKMGTSMTDVTNATEGVIQLKALSDAIYANPVASSIIYTDNDDILKSKNTLGQTKALSSIGAVAQAFSGGNIITIVNNNTFTQLLANFAISENVDFILSGASNEYLVYNGASQKRVWIECSLNVNTGAVASSYELELVINAVVNGSSEYVSGNQLAQTLHRLTFSAGTEYKSCSMTAIITLSPGDTISIFGQSLTLPDNIRCQLSSLYVKAFSIGTD